MAIIKQQEYYISLVHELRKLPIETEWMELKRNYADEEDLGEYLSALSNSAAMHGKVSAYMI